MNNTDPTSFESILAGVKRLRQQHGANDNDAARNPHQESRNEVNDRERNLEQGSAQERQITNNIQTSQTDVPKEPIINAITRDPTQFDKDIQESDETSSFNGNKRSLNNTNLDARVISKAVLVNTTQKDNPLLNHLKNTNWRYTSSKGGQKIYYDYLVRQRPVLFLTLTYHKLYADYITRRMTPLSKNDNNILIFVVDDSNSEDTLRELTKLCMFNGFTLLVAFSFEQSAKYIQYLNK
ncbi:hypothetical protein TPHA_0I00120 [Tetrapisispora phaffii CBS 4417]|uniref:ERCC1-like central domain-containing protein n=1 Tax=Tetrapisispora phaffii (strain ATCC 24235 / CBS 4417 / NBRC 1672 / NRRL Y-8282 / UCD 70-5) TaxID=1071381 RepID=G8BX91_TETPH|nr:hypothetical protein TPHA_0I00120 [Tetrapisispora phaffii CBS 4417]CCE64519.1 hypothetical protein TPHA_0I00120 [Tetrapisispora phaffii CBS 4417]